MVWKIVFWFYLIYSVLAIVGMFVSFGQLSLAYLLLCAIQVIMFVLGIYGYVYERALFSKKYWKVFFVYVCMFWIFALLSFIPQFELLRAFIGKTYFMHTPLSFVSTLLSLLFDIPAFYALYTLGFATRLKK